MTPFVDAPDQVQHLRHDLIVPGDNDRKDFEQSELRKLAESLRAEGLAQPITVRPILTAAGEWAGRYQIVAGERRWRAAGLLEWTHIPAIVRVLTDEQAARIMLAENEERVDLNPIEQGAAYQKWMDKFGWTPAQVAEAAHRSVDYVKGRVLLLRLIDEAQHLLKQGSLPLSYAQIMVDLDSNRQHVALTYLAKASYYNLDSFREVVSGLLTAQQQDAMFDLDLFMVKQTPATYGAPKEEYRLYPMNPDLPKMRKQRNTALSLEHYIADLLAAGHTEAAAVVGTVYDGLLRNNLCWLPSTSPLDPAKQEGR